MDLLAMMQKEITELQLTDKVAIKDHIYRRTGEIFKYDPLWTFASNEREKLRQKRIDIRNVTDFELTCYSWAHAFKDLLLEFLIPARVSVKNDHAYVESFIYGETYFSDLMLNLEDIKRIKFGMNTINNFKLTNNKTSQASNRATENNDATSFNAEVLLQKFKPKLDTLKSKINYDQYVYYTFQIAEFFINNYFAKTDIGYVSGLKFICQLLQTFISNNYAPYNTHFFDIENKIYKEVYSIPFNGNIKYFAYEQNDEGVYNLHEISKEMIDSYMNKYYSMRSYNLSLQKKSQSNNKNISEPLFIEKYEYSKIKKK